MSGLAGPRSLCTTRCGTPELIGRVQSVSLTPAAAGPPDAGLLRARFPASARARRGRGGCQQRVLLAQSVHARAHERRQVLRRPQTWWLRRWSTAPSCRPHRS